MHKYLLTGTMVITCFLFGAGSMYLIDSTWVYDKVERSKEQSNKKVERYVEAIDVSQQLLDNSYDAFFTVSQCSTKVGCDFVSTVYSLTALNIERKILQRRLDQLLEETEARSAK